MNGSATPRPPLTTYTRSRAQVTQLSLQLTANPNGGSRPTMSEEPRTQRQLARLIASAAVRTHNPSLDNNRAIVAAVASVGELRGLTTPSWSWAPLETKNPYQIALALVRSQRKPVSAPHFSCECEHVHHFETAGVHPYGHLCLGEPLTIHTHYGPYKVCQACADTCMVAR